MKQTIASLTKRIEELERKCGRYRDMTKSWGPNLPKRQPACKYFEPKPPKAQ